MKKLKLVCFLAMVAVLAIVGLCFGADVVAPVVATVDPAVVPAVPAAATNTFQTVLIWMQANQVVVGLLLASVLDFIFAINPAWKSNGALHFIYTLAQKKSGTPPPPAA